MTSLRCHVPAEWYPSLNRDIRRYPAHINIFQFSFSLFRNNFEISDAQTCFKVAYECKFCGVGRGNFSDGLLQAKSYVGAPIAQSVLWFGFIYPLYVLIGSCCHCTSIISFSKTIFAGPSDSAET